ncbi:MAG TPA: methylmalonyl-CoA mutase family protein [Myxococcota bacterium]|nr:methylmalonyl-CoA mutase family protein [Myxococcota bacterium]
MTAAANVTPLHRAPQRIRVVTAASLFDGHDAAINIMRRLLQQQGAEVIHLGHDRSVDEIVEAALHEDAQAVAISSYQGGHVEFFKYLVDRLRALGAGHVRVYGGGGGTIVPEEIAELQAYGVARLFSPEDGRTLGLGGMIGALLDECRQHALPPRAVDASELAGGAALAVARAITWFEEAAADALAPAEKLRASLRVQAAAKPVPVLGFTGPGGAGKSSVVDELVRRFRLDYPERRIGLLLVDPTRRRSGGALLGDRIRMNSVHGAGVFVRSLATRQAHLALSQAVQDAVLVLRAAGFDLVLVETAGIGQSDSEIVDLADAAVYVMTPEYGAPSQLEKIDMLELASLVVLNKSDRRGAADALRDVRKQWRRNHPDAGGADDALPVFATVASQWDDPGVERLFAALRAKLEALGGAFPARASAAHVPIASPPPLVPTGRERYLDEIAQAVRRYKARSEELAATAHAAQALRDSARELADAPAELREALAAKAAAREAELDPELRSALAEWPARRARYEAERQHYVVRGRAIEVENTATTLSGTKLPRIAVPRETDAGALTRFLRQENLPGEFPYTAGVFPFKRPEEEPARMFAGEGEPERTNRRFHVLAAAQPATRLSTAFDSVTLYGRDPDERPDIYGKVGTSGVSVCTVDDAKKLYSGFDLCDPATSVSMTINGPAPTILAFFLNAAIDQQVEKHLRERGELDALRARLAGRGLPTYQGALPHGHDGLGIGLLGIRGDEAVDAETYARIKRDVLSRVRGTVQADILKEDQAQNTCIFSTDFSLKVMGDIQEYFVRNKVRNFYSVSISGYHIAEAGANPITQLAFTLANGFTYVEAYRARGMRVDDFAPNFSFFFSNGLDAEYNVIGRVARRIWAIALRDVYGGDERSQKLKYHIQTSGRSLHAQEMAFNDIRTTLQALTAIQDHCNSLHTNAYDEAVTTPTEESVRRALAIQLVINRELGIARNENALQGSYAIEWLTDAVEEAVLDEFERLAQRGGVLGAMETHYQRGKIQDESLYYEAKKHSGELPIIGVNTFENPHPERSQRPLALQRASDDEKQRQLAALRAFQARHAEDAPRALARLREVARSGGNVFEELMETVKSASLGQITHALFDVGGSYRRSM